MPAHKNREESLQDSLPHYGGSHNIAVPTRYTQMLLEADEVSRRHNILAALSTWIILAGYIVFPGTFSKLQKNRRLEDAKDDDHDDDKLVELKMKALRAVRNIPLLAIASTSCAIGVVICVLLGWKYRRNYIWVINKIFLPLALHSVAGLVSTLVNIYTAQEGQISITAQWTLALTSLCLVLAAFGLLFYNWFWLRAIKRDHKRGVR